MLEISSIFILYQVLMRVADQSKQEIVCLYVSKPGVTHNTPIACSSLNELWKNLYVFTNNCSL